MSTAPVLLCEGTQDDEFFKHLAEDRGLQEPTVVPRKASGEGAFTIRLEGVPTIPGIRQRCAILLVADNDLEPDVKFEGVRQQIRHANSLPRVAMVGQFGVPDQPRTLASSTNGLPPVAILMMPWDGVQGCLDTVCLESAANLRPAHAACVNHYLACVQTAQPVAWLAHKIDKMKLHCLIAGACPDDPCTTLKFAWSDNGRRPLPLIPFDTPDVNRIAEYLARFWPAKAK